MKRTDFYYDLPQELIAQYPSDKRSDSRLLCLNKQTGEITHKRFFDIHEFFKKNDCLVLNNSKVFKARLFGTKETGGKIEVMIERLLSNNEVLAHVRSNHAPKAGYKITLENEICAEVLGRAGDLFHIKFLITEPILSVLNKFGRIPLPPYINREADSIDNDRYQTIYADKVGSVAAPTAGLHFDDELFELLNKKGIKKEFVTLHVGAGTFQPVKTDLIKEHKMHVEYVELNQKTCDEINLTKQKNGRIIAVGTTSVRSLESAMKANLNKTIQPFSGETDIFIYPGYSFKVVDVIITNFHLPESTLLMLISAFAGRDKIFNAYEVAIREGYQFFSYGDAMLIY